jgi:oligopeptide transport system substrate-binding protein
MLSPADADADADEPFEPRARRGLAAVALLLVVALVVTAVTWYGSAPVAPAAPADATGGSLAAAAPRGDVDARIVGYAPADWDPAMQSDYGSATTIAQVFESLTAVDAQGAVQPALAATWSVEDGGRRVAFTLRPGITDSDGTPITSADVVTSWLRLIDPARPSPLASLLSDVVGANERLAGRIGPDGVGIRADGDRVVVDFRRPAAYFPSVAASPSLAVLPAAAMAAFQGSLLPAGLVVSGAYVPTSQTATAIRLEANPRYWAGAPALKVVEIVFDLGGKSVVEAFEAGDIDYSQLDAFDAGWVRYDADLGPQLLERTEMAVDYYGFDATKPPFDDARVRRAFVQAIDWHRLVELTTPDDIGATSMLPPGMPGRSDTDFTPSYDPQAARAALAEAGYPGGAGFPEVALVTQGYLWDEPIAAEIARVLGVHLRLELMPSAEYFARLEEPDRPAFWAMSWVADYPAPQDFLGLLLETGSTNNYGRWSEPRYDAALDAAAATGDPAEQQARYDDAQAIVRDEAPAIPVAYHAGWALARTGLEGTAVSGTGILRFAGLDWADR